VFAQVEKDVDGCAKAFFSELFSECPEAVCYHAFLETTQGQIDGFSSQLPFRCYLPEATSVGDWLMTCPWAACRAACSRTCGYSERCLCQLGSTNLVRALSPSNVNGFVPHTESADLRIAGQPE
jgi:hypothetical protein